ncbi:flavin prenyltransferase UbiX [Prochlorococcus marinus]|uniref:Flavin prenyltransferase UbiX n=1 Tax=Prochlorococcus marinus (strain MIT 9211) TaxID=93059 RepID=A9BAI5_PROM4|nr:flavin prenyltransferase UbiX [Prochlorococcus marinus]ABX08847.1 3-polyprenyl-4-hydroxybenzoate decarboxylase [Prochlorococcus marinus str. MIT 9211]
MTKIVLAVTGASAQPIAERSLELLLKNNLEVHLILSKGAYKVWDAEANTKIPFDPASQEKFWRNRLKINSGKLNCYKWNDNSASIASGSVHTDGMIIVPCTMGTIGRISNGFALDLIERCADVHLKELRKLVISPRESPFNLIHLRNMTKLAEAGAHIVPCIPAWYGSPNSLEDMINFLVVRLFDSFNLDLLKIKRWKDY